MCSTISSFIAGYSSCQHIKDSTPSTLGLLQPPSIPSHCFESCSLDLIIDLQLFYGFNAVFICVDHLIKLCRLTPSFMGGSYLGAGEVACLLFYLVI